MYQFSKIAILTGFTILISASITIAKTHSSQGRRGTVLKSSQPTSNSRNHSDTHQRNRADSSDQFTLKNNSQLRDSRREFSRESIHPGNVSIPKASRRNDWVRINPAGNVLNLEVQRHRISEKGNLPIVDLPQILTGGTRQHATTIHLRENGTIQLTHPESFNPVVHRGRNISERFLSEASIREMLSRIEAKTDQKPAVIYAITHPEQLINPVEGIELQSQTGLTLMLVLPNGQSIVKSIPEVQRKKLDQVTREFYREVSDPRTRGWPAAQQLYQWLIAPLEADLKEANIDTLLFDLDEELRSIPLAALHDGQQFLIETYNFSLIPSLSLTNASYKNLQDAEVLGMGMSEFVNQPSLPSVPTEILTITEKLWSGEALLNQAFTLENLQKKRNQQAFKIIHLATHTNFTLQHNPYIQFWDQKLSLKQLRDLGWYQQPQVELLVLSACKTALGNTSETEMGFAGIAHQAGVKSALASLWEVSDIGSLRLMLEFYRHLKSSSIKAEALRQAQLAMLHGEVKIPADLLHSTDGDVLVSKTLAVRLQTEDLSHPYYWAGFTMIGSPW